MPKSTLIWVADVVANTRIAELDVEKDGIGRVLADEYLEVRGAHGVYAVGDCAHFIAPASGQPVLPSSTYGSTPGKDSCSQCSG